MDQAAEQQAQDGLNADIGINGFRAWLSDRLGETETDDLLRRYPLEAAGGVRRIAPR